MAVAQAVFLLPVRKPGAATNTVTPLWVSLAMAGLGIGALAGAMLLAVWYTIDLALLPRFHRHIVGTMDLIDIAASSQKSEVL